MSNWDDYPDPMAPPSGAQPPSADATAWPQPDAKPQWPAEVGYVEDTAKGAAGGLGRGTAGVLGTGGTIGNVARWTAGKLGMSDENIENSANFVRGLASIGNPIAKAVTGPDPAQIQRSIEGYTGPFYEPKYLPGQFASTFMEFAPGMAIPGGGGVGARLLNTAIPAVASEGAGQLTKGTAAEPWARGGAAILGGLGGAKMITPTAPASAIRQGAVDTFDKYGIPTTAGQRTGSKALQWMESSAADMPFVGPSAREMYGNQQTALDKAVTEHMFDPQKLKAAGVEEGTHLPDKSVVVAGKQSLGDEYTRLSQNELKSDPQLHTDFAKAQTKYEQNVLPSQRTADVEKIRNDITDQLINGQGRMSGEAYQATRSRLTSLAEGSKNDPYLSGAFRDLRKALDEGMARGLSPADAEAWALNNQRYANMKTFEPTVAKAGEHLSPQSLATDARAGRQGQYAAHVGDMDELAHAADLLIKPLPNSGTAARSEYQKLFSLPGAISAGAAAAGSHYGGMELALAGAAAPFAFSKAVVSRPGQAYLGNQLVPQNAKDIIAQTLMAQDASQPSLVRRNQAERKRFDENIPDPLYPQGQ